MTPPHKNFSWQTALAQMIQCPLTLLRELELTPEQCGVSQEAVAQFPLKVTHAYVARMRRGDPRDPLLLQVLPALQEMELIPGYSLDPLQEETFAPVPGLLHKYHGRVLWVTTGTCAIHCRFCFRRHFPYEAHRLAVNQREEVLTYIHQHSEIFEVILSGSEPLSLSDDYLEKLILQLEAIPHLTTLRLHTRMPIVLPSRLTDELLQILTATRLKIVIVTHCNHPQEIDAEVTSRLQQLQRLGFCLLNHTVLLKNINDDVHVLVELSQKLLVSGVLPYYLNQLDRVQGSAHFEVPLEKAKALHQQLRSLLPGYLVPRFTLEQPGEKSKSYL